MKANECFEEQEFNEARGTYISAAEKHLQSLEREVIIDFANLVDEFFDINLGMETESITMASSMGTSISIATMHTDGTIFPEELDFAQVTQKDGNEAPNITQQTTAADDRESEASAGYG
jgi:hypothetical protein